MAYDGNRTWDQFERQINNVGSSLINNVKKGEELYRDLIVYADGRTNAQIAQDLAVAESWVDDLQTALVALHRIHEICEGSTTTPLGEYFNDIRMFT